jgi:hypothetical protein
LRIDTPIKDLIEQAAQLARPLLSRRVLLTIFRGLERLHMRRATESPLRFAPVCFPRFPGCRAKGGEAEEDPEGPFSAVDFA